MSCFKDNHTIYIIISDVVKQVADCLVIMVRCVTGCVTVMMTSTAIQLEDVSAYRDIHVTTIHWVSIILYDDLNE